MVRRKAASPTTRPTSKRTRRCRKSFRLLDSSDNKFSPNALIEQGARPEMFVVAQIGRHTSNLDRVCDVQASIIYLALRLSLTSTAVAGRLLLRNLLFGEQEAGAGGERGVAAPLQPWEPNCS